MNCTAVWKTRSGESIARSSLHLWQKKEFIEIDMYFAAGEYDVELELPSGQRVGQEFTVSLRKSGSPVVVRLK